jgi:aryl-alcohol dehydrogenase
VATVQEICGGPADFALDCAGNVNVLRQAADSVGMRGTVALIGGASPGADFSLEHRPTLWGKTVVGILGGEGRSVSLIGTLMALNAQGRVTWMRGGRLGAGIWVRGGRVSCCYHGRSRCVG